jgi:hypothetical protein
LPGLGLDGTLGETRIRSKALELRLQAPRLLVKLLSVELLSVSRFLHISDVAGQRFGGPLYMLDLGQ